MRNLMGKILLISLKLNFSKYFGRLWVDLGPYSRFSNIVLDGVFANTELALASNNELGFLDDKTAMTRI